MHVNDIVGERAHDTVAQIVDAGGSAAIAPFDVTDYDAVSAAIADVGAVDILVNNAGNGGAEGMGLVQFRDSEPAGWRARSTSTSSASCTALARSSTGCASAASVG